MEHINTYHNILTEEILRKTHWKATTQTDDGIPDLSADWNPLEPGFSWACRSCSLKPGLSFLKSGLSGHVARSCSIWRHRWHQKSWGHSLALNAQVRSRSIGFNLYPFSTKTKTYRKISWQFWAICVQQIFGHQIGGNKSVSRKASNWVPLASWNPGWTPQAGRNSERWPIGWLHHGLMMGSCAYWFSMVQCFFTTLSWETL